MGTETVPIPFLFEQGRSNVWGLIIESTCSHFPRPFVPVLFCRQRPHPTHHAGCHSISSVSPSIPKPPSTTSGRITQASQLDWALRQAHQIPSLTESSGRHVKLYFRKPQSWAEKGAPAGYKEPGPWSTGHTNAAVQDSPACRFRVRFQHFQARWTFKNIRFTPIVTLLKKSKQEKIQLFTRAHPMSPSVES